MLFSFRPAEVSILAVFHHLVALFGAHCIPRFLERAQAPWKFRDYSNPITIESSNVKNRVRYTYLRLPFTRVIHRVRYKRVYLPFQPGIFYANVTWKRNVSTLECIFIARERWFCDAVRNEEKVRLWSLFLGRWCDNCVDNCYVSNIFVQDYSILFLREKELNFSISNFVFDRITQLKLVNSLEYAWNKILVFDFFWEN